MVEGRIVHIQLQIHFLELLAAKIAGSQVTGDLGIPKPLSQKAAECLAREQRTPPQTVSCVYVNLTQAKVT